jgi:hypothetical protein
VVAQNKIQVEPFTTQRFVELVRRAGGGVVTRQVEYLGRYLEELKVRTIVRESRYVDRHYMDEYALYYSRMLNAPPNTVMRIHFFEKKFTASALRRWMAAAFSGDEVATTIDAEAGRYFGFSCIRPIADSPIGRTVLARWADDDKPRDIWTVGKHSVHIGNLAFDVVGLPFQQQEAAVGACATASVWSALSKVARHDGMRAPTPAEIADAVERPANAHSGAPLAPTTGWTVDEVCTAIQAFGFTAVTVASARPETLAFALHSYLQSGIPVVVVLRGSGRAHAVTAVGFQLSGSERADLECSVATRSMELRKLYVHDDRIGPYARASVTPYAARFETPSEFEVEPLEELETNEGLSFEIETELAKSEHWLVEALVIPVYPKVRLGLPSLLGLATAMQPLVEDSAGADAFDLRADVRYVRSGEYLPSVAGKIAPTAAASMAGRLAMSRWCAIIRWSARGEPLVEFVYDTTDILRDNGAEQLLAIVALAPRVRASVYALADRLRVPRA